MDEDPTRTLLASERQFPTRFRERFNINRCIGRGAGGEVYLAEDTLLSRQVAVKTVNIAEPADAELAQDLRERFKIEASAAARISHPNVVTVFDYAVEEDVQFIVMEYVEGKALSRVIAEQAPLDEARVLAILRRICQGLKAIHEVGIVHRDLKPSNIMCGTEQDVVKIMDLGIARLDDSDMTRTGTIIGTLNYMSPEQAQGYRVNGASDIFSFGCIAYELVTGEKAFPGRSPTSALYRIVNEAPPLPTRIKPSLPPFWDDFISRCLEKNPERRFRDCDEILESLENRNMARSREDADDPEEPADVEQTRRTGAIRRATQSVLDTPWMTGEVYWASNVLTFGMSSLAIPYLMIRNFVGALSEEFRKDEFKKGEGQHFADFARYFDGAHALQLFGSWLLAGFGIVVGIVSVLQILNIEFISEDFFQASARNAKYWLAASEIALFSGWVLFLLWLYRASRRLDRGLQALRSPLTDDGTLDRSRRFGHVYHLIVESGCVMLAIGIQIPIIFDYLTKNFLRSLQLEATTALKTFYVVEYSVFFPLALLLIYFAHGYVRYVTRVLLMRVVMDEELGPRSTLAFGFSRILCAVLILIIPFYLNREGLVKGLSLLVQPS